MLAINILKTRRLIYIPIIHTKVDMGTLSNSFQEEYIEKHGEKQWQQHTGQIVELWSGLIRRIFRLHLKWKQVRLYQDGVPVCGTEKEMVESLAAKGSKNHIVLQRLIDNGAILEGTEDSPLLIKEYDLIKTVLEAKTEQERQAAVEKYNVQAAELLSQRDTFIAKRIDETLKKDETGILFIGLLHHVDERLPSDIQINYLVHRLPFKRQFRINEV